MQRIPRKRGFGRYLRPLFISCLFALILLFWIASPERSVGLSDGSRLRLLGVSQGKNTFKTGSTLERLLGDRIPANGLEVLGWKLERSRLLGPVYPEAPLVIWVERTPSGPQPLGSVWGARTPSGAPMIAGYWADWRIIAANANGRELENPPPHCYWASTKSVLAIPLHAFPRDQRTLHLKVLPPPLSKAEPGLVEFQVANPFRPKPREWVPAPLPLTNTVDDLQVVLAEIRLAPTEISFGVSSKDWRLLECRIIDEEQNVRSLAEFSHPDATNFVRAEFEHGLEPHRTWKVEASFIRAPAFPHGRGFNFPAEERITLQVNSDGKDVAFTNALGTAFVCRLKSLQRNQLFIREPNGLERPHFVVIGATNELGEPIRFKGGIVWFQTFGPGPTQLWQAKGSAGSFTLHLACPKVVTTEFYVRPGG